jgi:hypothetical protein
MPWCLNGPRPIGRRRELVRRLPHRIDRRRSSSPERRGPSSERERIVSIRKGYSDPANQLIEPVRVADRSVSQTEIRDIHDLNVHRRTPRTVHTYKNCTVTDALLKGGTISRRHARAAETFRNQYEKAGKMGLGQSDWGAAKSGGFGPSAGLSETQMFAIDAMRVAKSLLGRLWDLVVCVVVEDLTLRKYAERTRSNASVCTGRLLGAPDVLDSHYSPDPGGERHTSLANTTNQALRRAATRSAAD